MKIRTSRWIGICLATSAAVLWGVSGTCGQFLFEEREVQTEWLVAVRLLIAGTLLLIFATWQNSREVISIWWKGSNAAQLLVFGLVGMLGVQYTFFSAIHHSNAATATVLQSVGPSLIAIYLAFRHQRAPRPRECLAIVLAVTGTFLIATHGNPGTLSISTAALLWGLGSALGLAIYTIQPGNLLRQFSSATVIGWGMVIGGTVLGAFFPPWKVTGTWDLKAFLAAFVIIIPGCLMAFYAYLTAVKMIGSQKASLLGVAEPLAASVLAVMWLHVRFTAMDWTGSALILLTLFLLVEDEQKELEEIELAVVAGRANA